MKKANIIGIICLWLILGTSAIIVLAKSVQHVYKGNMKEAEDQLIADVVSSQIAIDEVFMHPAFMDATIPDSTLLFEALIYYNIQFPEIVYAQAILETGNFKSTICRQYKNLFGLWNSNTKDYYKFDHWSESILAYKMFIQSKYEPPEDYFLFLQEMRYAEDTLYISKLQTIVGQIKFN